MIFDIELSEEEKDELVSYGLMRVRGILISTLLVIGMGYLFGVPWNALVFWFTFCIIRRYAGGYHADDRIRCYVISLLILTGVILGIKYVRINEYLLFGIHLFCLILICALAPVETENKRLEADEKIRYKRKTKRNAIVVFTFSGVMYLIGEYHFVFAEAAAYIVVTVLLLVGKLKNQVRRREVN